MNSLKIIRGIKDSNSFYVESNYGLILFDTGAGSSQLLKSSVTESLEKCEEVEAHGAFGSKKLDRVIVDELCIGDIKQKNLTVTLDDEVGILGLDVLSNYAFTLDTINDEIILLDSFESDIQLIKGQMGHLYVEIELGGKKGLALLDTGASGSIIDEAFYFETFGDTSNLDVDEGEDWTGAVFEAKVVLLDSLSINNIRFPEHEFGVIDFKKMFPFMEYPIIAIIGATTLTCKKFSFSLPNGYLKIEN